MQNKLAGFTLVELMVTIAVAAILLAIGVPSLTSLYENMRVNSNLTKIHDIMVFARSQAISYGMTVNVCPYRSETACGTDWSNGIRVYTLANSTPLRVINSFSANDSIQGPTTDITFSPDGLSTGAKLIYIPSGKAELSKSIFVNAGGIISYYDKSVAN